MIGVGVEWPVGVALCKLGDSVRMNGDVLGAIDDPFTGISDKLALIGHGIRL